MKKKEQEFKNEIDNILESYHKKGIDLLEVRKNFILCAKQYHSSNDSVEGLKKELKETKLALKIETMAVKERDNLNKSLQEKILDLQKQHSIEGLREEKLFTEQNMKDCFNAGMVYHRDSDNSFANVFNFKNWMKKTFNR